MCLHCYQPSGRSRELFGEQNVCAALSDNGASILARSAKIEAQKIGQYLAAAGRISQQCVPGRAL
jgi:hypothetical protein